MITYLRGEIVEKNPVAVVLDVGGIGYEVFIPLSTYEELPDDGQTVKLFTRQIIREDAHTLYGFSAEEAREMFDLLIGISGVGPRLAIAILSSMTMQEFSRAIRERNEIALTVVPGIGKKTAGRIVLELAEKVGRIMAGAETTPPEKLPPETDDQAMQALMALGLNQLEATKKLSKARTKLGNDANVEHLIKEALHL